MDELPRSKKGDEGPAADQRRPPPHQFPQPSFGSGRRGGGGGRHGPGGKPRGEKERDTGRARVFSSIGETSAQRIDRIKHNLARSGRVDATRVTTFTDGGGALRQVARGSGLTEMPVLDWHHVAQRLQHVHQAAAGLKSNVPDLPGVTAPNASFRFAPLSSTATRRRSPHQRDPQLFSTSGGPGFM